MLRYLKRNRGRTLCFALAIAAVFVGVSSYAQRTPPIRGAAGTSTDPQLVFANMFIGPVEGLSTLVTQMSSDSRRPTTRPVVSFHAGLPRSFRRLRLQI